jgi:uncharacterized repeat protein (TIGR01451 family)
MSGCKTLSLPAIDPTGNRIFSGGVTNIVSPHDPNNGYPSTAPAYQNPPEPPACMQGTDGSEKKLCQGCLSGKGCLAKKKNAEEIRGRCGQLLLTPTKIVAPVGGEVILLAGVCGKDEYLVTNEPIEWMLAPNSVGEFIEVGDDAKGQRRSTWKRDDRPKVEKLGIDFARGRTSNEASVITRGTSDKADDLPIRKGQTWISLTSPTEGVSKVTALAPDSDVWDQRRQTATIYWIDATWQFPAPQALPSGREATLVTRVMRSDGLHASGWNVRFRSLNPEFARFVPTNAEVADIKVDQNGIAAVNIIHGSSTNAAAAAFGTAMVEIEIVKPYEASENMPELQIARGTTTVTWNAPALVLDAVGPEVAVPGQDLPYLLSVANIGDIVAENTILTVTLPAGMQVRSASYAPDAQATNDTVRWTIGPLEARRRFDVTLTLVAAAEMDARVTVNVVGTPNLQQQRVLQTLVQKPSVGLQFTPLRNQTQFEVGQEAAFKLLVTNTGNQTMNNVTVTLVSDTGLMHIRGGNESIQNIDFIPPGQSRELDAVYVVQREGSLCVNATLQSMNQVLTAQKVCIQGVPATAKRPAVKLQVDGVSKQEPAEIGEEFEMTWSVSNTGQTVLRAPIVSLQHDPRLEVTGLDRGFEAQRERQFYFWRVPDMPVGNRATYKARFRGTAAIPNATIALMVETADGLSDRQTLTIGIGAGGAAPMVSSNAASSAPNEILPNAGGGALRSNFGSVPDASSSTSTESANNRALRATIVPVNHATKAGDVGTYEVRIENLKNQPQQQVTFKIQYPESVSLYSIRAKELKYRLSNSDRQIDFEPIKFLRANEVFSCVIQLRADQLTNGEITATVTSSSQTDPSIHRMSLQANR